MSYLIFNEFLLPIYDIKEAIFEESYISGSEPPICVESFRIGSRIIVITSENHRTFDIEFSFLTHCYIFAVFIYNSIPK